jgi:DNA mismatch repair protein MutH
MNKIIPYDRNSESSIVEYATQIIGKTLREVTGIDHIDDPSVRKGSFGNAVEYYFFKFDPNSDPNPDFNEVGIELKTTPLKKTKRGDIVSKERLVLSMINYMDVVNETWETSTVLKKSSKILLMSYLYEPDANPVDYEFYIVELWGIPEEDFYTIKNDWETVVNKVRTGRAHEISGSDTLYLEACTKSANSNVRREQPYSDIPAKPRAWAFKQSYMTTISKKLLDAQGIQRDVSQKQLSLKELVEQRFAKYAGLTENELACDFGLLKDGKKKPKNLCALITKRILGVDPDSKILEFEKAGIKTKTMRLKKNGIPKESISFPAFDYFDIAEKDFEESDFYEQLQQKYLFVIYREDLSVRDIYRLDGVLFWQMPEADLEEAEKCYNAMHENVRSGHADRSVKSSENRCCHVRPHAIDSNDTIMTPYGKPVVKKSFWLNAEYIALEIKRLIEENS